ncbi:MAG: M3 family metallopeptidase [Verrucomicrobiota bacterium]
MPEEPSHPFLDDSFPIRWKPLTPSDLGPDIRFALEEAQQHIDALCEAFDPNELTFASTLLALEEATRQLGEAWGKAGHLDSVCNSDELREAYNALLPDVSAFFARIPLNDALWKRLKAYSETREAAELSGAKKRFLEETLADFRESGAELPPEQKERLKEIQAALAEKTQKFSENVLDATNAWELIVTDESRLDGLPSTIKDATRADAKANDHGTEEEPAWRLTLKAPVLIPVLEHVHDDSLRKEIWEASSQVARNGEHDNRELIAEILKLRHEKANMLGFKDFADYILQRRMAKSGEKALAFTEDLHRRAEEAFAKECTELEAFKAAETGEETPFEPWQIAYWSEKQRKAKYDFDDEVLRPYFPMDKVLAGMFAIAEKVFGVTIKEGNAETWHEEVLFFDMTDSTSGNHIGSFYADWHPRDSKRSGAWMNYLKTGNRASDNPLTPHLGLICGNMTPPVDGKPALLTHEEVSTIFHEFGHLLHHLLGEVEIRSLNGVNVAWDFVELPSQFMENFCWERESLDFFARHHESGEPIPDELFDKMLAARTYRSASAMMRQLGLGKLDLDLHIHHATEEPFDIDAISKKATEGYRIPTKTEAPSMAPKFGHLFSGPTGYAAGYYSYKWAEVLDADAFSRFLEAGVLNGDVGREYRAKILSKGNSEPPEKLFHDFMGRDPDLTAMLKRDGLAA